MKFCTVQAAERIVCSQLLSFSSSVSHSETETKKRQTMKCLWSNHEESFLFFYIFYLLFVCVGWFFLCSVICHSSFADVCPSQSHFCFQTSSSSFCVWHNDWLIDADPAWESNTENPPKTGKIHRFYTSKCVSWSDLSSASCLEVVSSLQSGKWPRVMSLESATVEADLCSCCRLH